MNYHEQAQAFIKSSHAQGRNVTAEGTELIASQPGSYGTHLDAHIQTKQAEHASQANTYNKAMLSAQRKGGSNGIGVGN